MATKGFYFAASLLVLANLVAANEEDEPFENEDDCQALQDDYMKAKAILED